MGSKVSEVNFFAYCTAFKAVNKTLSDEICYALDTSKDAWTPKMFRDETGDGFIITPSHKNIMGRKRLSSWQSLSEDGDIKKDFGNDAVLLKHIDETAAAHFIAGAFGVDELTDASGVDKAFARAMHKLYGICVKDVEKCLDTEEAALVSQLWSKAQKNIKQ